MKKSLLALIMAPFFVQAADVKNYTIVNIPSLFSESTVEFAEKKTEGDRAAGISELKQINHFLGQNIRENYEYLDDVKKEAADEATKLDGKIASVRKLADKTSQQVNTVIADVKGKIVPEYINTVLPRIVNDQVGNQLSPINKRTESLESMTQQLDTQLDITTRKSLHNNELIGTIPGMIKDEIGKASEAHGKYTDYHINDLKGLVYQNQLLLQDEKENTESVNVITRELAAASTALEKNINSLKSKVEFNEGMAINANYGADANEASIGKNSTQLEKHKADIDENKAFIESAKVVTGVIMDATTRLESDVDALNTRVSNASKKANVTNNVATVNRKDIDQHTVKIEKNALDMLKNRQDLRGLENDLRETNERLDNGLAANAALNGLFQPYGIGKLNITAAMGGYNSTQAVAVGTGYRFNENIAMKTGVSYTGSNDVMYNMAVNLEW